MSAISSPDRELTYPVIIMRTGGLDGVALQAREYRHLLNRLDIHVHVMTGRCETKFEPHDPIGHKQTVISRLDFYHKDSRRLFANQFIRGSETEDGIEKISDSEWIEIFESHKKKIKKSIAKILKDIPYNTPVLVYNLVSLRHAHPAAAAAILEIMTDNPTRAFISHSADPDAERPEKIERIKEFVLPYISSAPPDKPYDGGPYKLDNLYHIVLNPTQRRNFVHKYGVPRNHVFEIPDFLDFVSRTPPIRMAPRRIFMSFVAERALRSTDKAYDYHTIPVNKEMVFFLSPVRPVYRKRLKRAMLLAHQYGKSRRREVAFVVTHPNTDDKQYFLDTVRFAEQLGLPYYHLGEKFSLATLDTIYENFAALKTIGVIASSAGGWENALNEMARACIPFYMDNKLNSFKPLTEEIGVKCHGTDFGSFTHFIHEWTPEELRDADLGGHEEMLAAFKFFDDMLDHDKRYELIRHNYGKAYDYLSHEATIPRLVDGINYIYKRHGHPAAGDIEADKLREIAHEPV